MTGRYVGRRRIGSGELFYIPWFRRSYEEEAWEDFRGNQYVEHLRKEWEGLDTVYAAVVATPESAKARQLVEIADVTVLAKQKESFNRQNRDISGFTEVEDADDLDVMTRLRKRRERTGASVEYLTVRNTDVRLVVQDTPLKGTRPPASWMAVPTDVALQMVSAAICTETRHIDGSPGWRFRREDYRPSTEFCGWLPELVDRRSDRDHVARFNEAMAQELRCRFVTRLIAAYNSRRTERLSSGQAPDTSCRFTLQFAIRWPDDPKRASERRPQVTRNTRNPYRCAALPAEDLITDTELAAVVMAVWQQTDEHFAVVLAADDPETVAEGEFIFAKADGDWTADTGVAAA